MCDTLVALAPVTLDGVTLFAKNSDRPPGERQILEWVPPRRDAGEVLLTHVTVPGAPFDTVATLISRPTWCWGAEHGVNAAGVAIGNEAIYTRLDPRPFPPALTGMDLVRLGLERSTTAEEAVATIAEMLERHGQGGSGHAGRSRPYWSSFLVADPGAAWVVETSGRTWCAEAVTDVRAISNRTTIASFDAEHRHPGQPVERTVDPRLQRSQAVLADRPVTFDGVVAHLRDHGDGPWSVCMHVETADDGGPEATTASIIVELPAGRPPVAWCAQGPPCTTERVRYDVDDRLTVTLPPGADVPPSHRAPRTRGGGRR